MAYVYRRLFHKPFLYPGSPLKFFDEREPLVEHEDYVKVKNILGGICGSDIHILNVDVSPTSSILSPAKIPQH